jgi:predicted protein tyrosine phosphatase
MKFLVCNRAEAVRWNPIKVPHIIISIYSSGGLPADVRRNEFTRAVGSWCFDDLDHHPGPAYVEVYGEPVMFNESMAEEILSFALDHLGVESIVVHCDAGISRSPAVAAALSVIFNGDDRSVLEGGSMYGGRRFCPNSFVYTTILGRIEKGLDRHE